ncbi:hypothetical protein P3X46_019134 [Hevea brasiliensis]|uniref:Epidermal patterning factor-like protein n=1 Tax=Hevea brasiliensis TaxID=3981 RepID=A0ABQ9LUH8_HEVBR|nr:protein EPIDERMAL PATTERNING FACTOR 1 [Hevea brasiliensis]XP_057984733.1 protein EPIDERMAL PATTERNING FACTOR 1 [Hevea brasiliensis]KAJ9170983.1 hypothetical protein P3X46_019039 [Hevea brasiliensis]KAJ9171086.1 hypothetical protein P3X46_019134 [Hevea brasiliensis]
MKGFVCVALLVIAFLSLPAVISARHIGRPRKHHGHHHSAPKEVAVANPNFYREMRATKRRGPDTVQIAGSSLPDCSHACGSCSPCRLVMVSFVCASLEEAETCPMAYKCMCKNKSYPVP